MKLLITSVGSLLGQNILDSIESRREFIEVLGINSIADNSRNFRCDVVYLVKDISHKDFGKDFQKLINSENPDFILPGRDEDCIFLAELKKADPVNLAKKIPFGDPYIPRIMYDKYESYVFCRNNNLPFADTILYEGKKDLPVLFKFLEGTGFPLVSKPRHGFGSRNVHFICNDEQLSEIAKESDLVFQEYLGQGHQVFQYQNSFNKGIPLFFQLPEEEQYTAQQIINPNGGVDEVFITINTMVFGRNELCKQIQNTEIDHLARKYCKTLYEHGWYGPVNIQLKQDKNGEWKVFEVNSRLSGSSSARTEMGYDEFGILTDIFASEHKIPNLTTKDKLAGHVYKYLTDCSVKATDIETLSKTKVWRKSS